MKIVQPIYSKYHSNPISNHQVLPSLIAEKRYYLINLLLSIKIRFISNHLEDVFIFMKMFKLVYIINQLYLDAFSTVYLLVEQIFILRNKNLCFKIGRCLLLYISLELMCLCLVVRYQLEILCYFSINGQFLPIVIILIIMNLLCRNITSFESLSTFHRFMLKYWPFLIFLIIFEITTLRFALKESGQVSSKIDDRGLKRIKNR